jgi:hypothetical protein
MYLGMSDQHLSMAPLVLNLESGAITPQFHVTLDDWFATVVADPSKFPDFDSPDWHALFSESAYQYIPSDGDDEVQEVPPPTDAEQARETRQDQLDALFRPAVPLDVPPPPTIPTAPPTPPAPVPPVQVTPPDHSLLPATPPPLNPTSNPSVSPIGTLTDSSVRTSAPPPTPRSTVSSTSTVPTPPPLAPPTPSTPMRELSKPVRPALSARPFV